MGKAVPFFFKLKHFVAKMTLCNKIKGLKWTGDKRMFQYEKPGQMREGDAQFLLSRPYFFIFRHNVVRGRLSILQLKFLL